MSRHRADGRQTSAAPNGFSLAALLLLASAVVWGCTGQASAADIATSQATRAAGSSDDARMAAAAIDAFGLDLYRTALTPGSNAVVSPASIVIALSMAQVGARGETESQMDTVLHSAAGSANGNGMNSLDRALTGLSGTFGTGSDARQVTLRIANAPFAQRDMTWQQAFLDTLASRYGAGLRLVDFRSDPDGARRLINAWVSDQTEHRIPALLGNLSALTRLVLVNAIYLKAPWLKAFYETSTQNAAFTRPDGSQVTVPTMSSDKAATRYASGEGWQAVELPYANPSLAMTIIVPDNLTGFEQDLNATRFAAITSALRSTSVQLTLPRFKIETKADLVSALSTMGMPLAFDPDRADFSGITTPERLFISQVAHEANISVDEKGTEASAATAVVMELTATPAEPVVVHVDRPFIFALRDTTTGAILFLGRVVDPSA